MTKTDQILDFAIDWSEQMLINGSNLERVTENLYRICAAYRLKKVNVFTLSSLVTIEARDNEGRIYHREKCIRSFGINLKKFDRLCLLAAKICAETPEPEELKGLLVDAVIIENSYPTWLVALGTAAAVGSIVAIFGGGVVEASVTAVLALLMYWFVFKFKSLIGNSFVCDGIAMFLAGVILKSLEIFGLIPDADLLMICSSFVLLPGIQMVNGFRNLLCGSPTNGIIEMVKVFIEIGIICGGVILGGMFAAFIF